MHLFQPDTVQYIATDTGDIGPPLYTNRIKGAVHMMRSSDGYYYAYDGGVANWPVFQSADGISWKKIKNKNYPAGTWGKANFWVPEVVESRGKYYMYYCAREDASRPSSRIGLAISDHPTGPFKDTGTPLFDGTIMEDWHVIDPNPFIDPATGKKYLYFVK